MRKEKGNGKREKKLVRKVQETETDEDGKDEEIERNSKEPQREEKQMVMTERC